MNNDGTQRWAGRYLGVAHRFIPADLQHDVVHSARAANVVNAAVMAGTAGPLYALAYWQLGLAMAALEILLCSLVMLSAPLVLRLSGSVIAARELFLCALFFNFTWLSWHLGGIVSPTVSWLITGPVAAMFLGGRRVRGAVEGLRCKVDGLGERVITLTVSVGVAEYRLGEGVAQTIGRADQALYLAKAGGRNRVLCHGDDGPAEVAAALPDARVAQGGGELFQRDQLTGLLNRRLLRDRLRHAMDRARRNGRLVALVLLNINRFKEVNDALGYEAADNLLTQAGHAIRRCLRDCDTVARWGGDEFVALLEDLGSQADAQLVAEKILDRFTAPLQVGGHDCFVTLAVGIALYPAPECDADALLKRADIAMRSAKGLGQNSVRVYSGGSDAGAASSSDSAPGSTSGLQSHLRSHSQPHSQPHSPPQSERLTLKNGLRDALALGQLYIEYQPQVELRERRVVGVEALLRWQHPVYGRIDPGRFIAQGFLLDRPLAPGLVAALLARQQREFAGSPGAPGDLALALPAALSAAPPVAPPAESTEPSTGPPAAPRLRCPHEAPEARMQPRSRIPRSATGGRRAE